MKSDKPKVTVVVPVYNVERYLDRCVQSLLGQTMKEIEIILVDDKSTDTSSDLCDKLSGLDCRVKVIHKPVNEGLGLARNTGIENASGKYIMFLDSDDTYDLDACRRLCEAAKENGADISTGLFNKEIRPGVWCAEHDKPQILNGDQVLQYTYDMIACSPEVYIERLHPVSACLLCINKDFLLSTGIRFESERKVASEDTLFKIKLLKECKRLAVLDYPFYNYFINGASLSHTFKYRDFENLKSLYSNMSQIFDMNNTDAQNRVSRFVMADARSQIFKLLDSDEPGKYRILKKMLENPIWSMTASFPIDLQPCSKYIFYVICRKKMHLPLFLYASAIRMLKR